MVGGGVKSRPHSLYYTLFIALPAPPLFLSFLLRCLITSLLVPLPALPLLFFYLPKSHQEISKIRVGCGRVNSGRGKILESKH